MKISIITVCFNAEKSIQRCLDSVDEQSYQNIEHIIIDGNSVDNTVKLLSNFESTKYFNFVSEKDKGIYDAMNKGIRLSTGDIVYFLNSDDYLIDNKVIERVLDLFQKLPVNVVYGAVRYINSDGKHLGFWEPTRYVKGSYQFGWHTPHPGFFAKRECYLEGGGFDTTMSVAADFDLMYRFMEILNYPSQKTDFAISTMSYDGMSASWRGRLTGFYDIRRSFKKQNKRFGIFSMLRYRYWPKLLRFYKS